MLDAEVTDGKKKIHEYMELVVVIASNKKNNGSVTMSMWKGSEKKLDKHLGRCGQCRVWDVMWQTWKFLFYSAFTGKPLKVEQGSEMIKACLQTVKKGKLSSGLQWRGRYV